MKIDEDKLIYLALGPLAAIFLGVALIPMRETAAAVNLEIPFIILTVVAAELGGYAAGFSAALVSTLSMDFFLTKPYLELTLIGKHDVSTFIGLLACGLVAAALGTRRVRHQRWNLPGAQRGSI
jgi:K+-sensing histidine kinase KdpD